MSQSLDHAILRLSLVFKRFPFFSMTRIRKPATFTKLGELIKQDLDKEGKTSVMLSRELGRSDLYFQRIFRGERNMPTEYLEQIARFVGHDTVPQSWLDAHDAPTTKKPAERTCFGKVFEAYLQERGFTPVDFSQKLGKYNFFIPYLITGKVKAKAEYLQDIANFFGFEEVPQAWIDAAKSDGQYFEIKRKNPVADWCRKVRNERYNGTTKELTAELSKLGFTFYNAVEIGQQYPSIHNLQIFADFMHATIPEELIKFIKDRRFDGLNKRKNMTPFGTIIQKERRKRHLTQKQLDEAIGCSGYNATQNVERGLMVNDWKVELFAEALGFEKVPHEWWTALAQGGQRMTTANGHEYPPEMLPPLGSLLRRLRWDNNISHEEIAERLGVSTSMYLNMELAGTAVNDDYLNQISHILTRQPASDEWFHLRQISRQVPQESEGDIHDHLSPFGVVVRTDRLKRGISLRDLGREIGYTSEMMSEIEFGRVNVPADTVEQISKVFGYSSVPEHYIKAISEENQIRELGLNGRYINAIKRKVTRENK